MLSVNHDRIDVGGSHAENDVEWRDVPGYEGLYQASTDGRIRSLDRDIVRPDGVVIRTVRGRELKRYPVGSYLNVHLSVDGKRHQVTVHKLVLLTFKGPLPDGQERLHGIGGPWDNSIGNLRYGTRAENVKDRVKHRAAKRKVGQTCSKGHDISEAVSWGTGNRMCQDCEAGKPRIRELPEWIF